MKKLKLYLETSVWSHYYADDVPEKMADTRALFDLITEKKYKIYTSRYVITEIDDAEELNKIKLQWLINKYNPVNLMYRNFHFFQTIFNNFNRAAGILPAGSRLYIT